VNSRAIQETKRFNARQPTQIDTRIGQLIRSRRLELGMRQEQLAAKLQITPHQLKKYEDGENRISASRLVVCASALQVSVVYFYQFADRPPAMMFDSDLPPDERDLLQLYRSLSTTLRQHFLTFLKLLCLDLKRDRSGPENT
jgi:transcriptional regulator with XRE-family HTH domain